MALVVAAGLWLCGQVAELSSFRMSVEKGGWHPSGAWQREIVVHVGAGLKDIRAPEWVARLRPGVVARVRCFAAEARCDEHGHLVSSPIKAAGRDAVCVYPQGAACLRAGPAPELRPRPGEVLR